MPFDAKKNSIDDLLALSKFGMADEMRKRHGLPPRSLPKAANDDIEVGDAPPDDSGVKLEDLLDGGDDEAAEGEAVPGDGAAKVKLEAKGLSPDDVQKLLELVQQMK